MKKKKFKNYTDNGLGISKTGRLQVPYVKSPGAYKGLNNFGQSLPIPGDILVISHPGFISKNTIYKVTGISSTCTKDDSIEVVNLDNGNPTSFWRKQGYILNNKEIEDLKMEGVIKDD